MARKKKYNKLKDIEYASTVIISCPENILELISEHCTIMMKNDLMCLVTIDNVIDVMDKESDPLLKKYIDHLIFLLDNGKQGVDLVMFIAIPQELKEQLVEKGLM